jgi:hypothetical protein
MDQDLGFAVTGSLNYLQGDVCCAKAFCPRKQAVAARCNILQFKTAISVGFDTRHELVVFFREKNETCPGNSSLLLGSYLNVSRTLNDLHLQRAVVDLIAIFICSPARRRIATLRCRRATGASNA